MLPTQVKNASIHATIFCSSDGGIFKFILVVRSKFLFNDSIIYCIGFPI